MPKYGGGQVLPIYPQFVKTSCVTVQAINRIALSIYNTDPNSPLFQVNTSTSTVTLNGTLSGTSLRLSLIDGTVSNPALKFQNSATSGLYMSAANQVSLAILGAEALRVDASGNTTVIGNLYVNGTSSTINSSIVQVSDNIITVGSGNVADSLDLGMCFQYVSAGTKYGALYRASGTDNWYIKDAISSSPGNTISGGTLANLYVAKIVPTSFQMATGAAASYILSSDSSGNGTWTALSALGVSSLTGTANQVIVSASTGSVTLSTPQSIGTGSTPQFAKLGLGVASSINAMILVTPSLTTSSSLGSGLSIDSGTYTIAGTGTAVNNIGLTTTTLATGSSFFAGIIYANLRANNSQVAKTGNGTISTAYGIYSDGFLSLGNVQYAGYFGAPSGGATANVALYADNMAIGTASTTPPANGLYVSGSVAFGSATTSNSLYVLASTGTGVNISSIGNSVNAYLFQLGGNIAQTDNAASNGSQICFLNQPSFSPPLGASSLFTQYCNPIYKVPTTKTVSSTYCMWSYPTYNNAANVGTITNAFNMYLGAGTGKTASGVITNAYGLYCEAPTCATTNECAYFGGRVSIGGSVSANTVFGIGANTTYQYWIDWRGTCTSSSGYIAGFNLGATLAPTAACAYGDQMSIYPIWNASSGAITNARALVISGGTTSGGTITNAWSLYVDPPLYGTNRYAAYFGGNVGIGTTAPTYQLELSTNSAGKPTSNVWTVTSDQRIKTNIQMVPLQECMDLINSLKIRSFGYHPVYAAQCKIADEERYGLIAQEVEEVAPYCVKTRSNVVYTHPETGETYEVTDLKVLDADELNYAMMGSVQYLSQKCAQLESMVNQLVAKNVELEATLAQLSNP
jgi:hypothetical protein